MATEVVQECVEGIHMVKPMKSEKEGLASSISSSDSCEGSATPQGNSNGSSVGTLESASSVTSDANSEEYSSDSGKGGSDTTVTPPDSIVGADGTVQVPNWQLCTQYNSYATYNKSLASMIPDLPMMYEFEIPQQIVGRLIGRHGAVVNKIKGDTGASILIKRHMIKMGVKICAVEGTCKQIHKALQEIRSRFPEKRYTNLTLEQCNPGFGAANISFIPNNRLTFIEGMINDVSLASVLDLDHIFMQQPTHPTFPALSRMHETLKSVYEMPHATPPMIRGFSPGVICVTKVGGSDWVRAEVVIIHTEKDTVTVRLVDIGGYVQVPIDELRQIRVDFVTIPFQSTECRLANIAPVNEKEGWSEEAVNFFRIMCQRHVLQAHVVGYCNRDGSTLINLYKPNGPTNHIFINEQMVTHNYAKWIDELNHQYYYTTETLYDVDQLSQNMGEWILAPGMVTLLPTEQMVDYNNSAGAANVYVPDLVASSLIADESQLYTTASDDTNETSDTLINTPNTVLSWADEMSSYDLEESSSNSKIETNNNTEDLVEKGEAKNARRKEKTKE